ncbi:hypothetical protein J6590_097779 [Homalodisca vitripennis]|nr:hypothetical protein J6590_097779 [Homalodisca vitripennis]
MEVVCSTCVRPNISIESTLCKHAEQIHFSRHDTYGVMEVDISIKSYLSKHAEQIHFSRPDTYGVMDVVCSTCVRPGHFYREYLV